MFCLFFVVTLGGGDGGGGGDGDGWNARKSARAKQQAMSTT